ncbi:fimbrial protein, partial [Escherichia coli]
MQSKMRLISSTLMGGIIFLSVNAKAVDIPVKITGTVYIPPCKVKNNTDFKISFGKIALQKVDGRNYAQSTTIEVNCEYYQGKPYILLSGGTGKLSGAPDNVLKTTGANSSTLGIALYQGGSVDPQKPLKLGTGETGPYGYEIRKGLSAINVQSSQFTFTSVPYKHGNTALNVGAFSA